jgi:hypothetical protein
LDLALSGSIPRIQVVWEFLERLLELYQTPPEKWWGFREGDSGRGSSKVLDIWRRLIFVLQLQRNPGRLAQDLAKPQDFFSLPVVQIGLKLAIVLKQTKLKSRFF